MLRVLPKRWFRNSALAVVCLAAVLQCAKSLLAQSRPATTSAPAAATAPAGILGTYQDRIAGEEIVGTWAADIVGTRTNLILRDDNSFSFGRLHGRYVTRDRQLRLHHDGAVVGYDYELTRSTLILRGGDLKKEIKFTRQTSLGEFLDGALDISPAALRHKVSRLVLVVVIVLAARLIIVGLQALSGFLIYSGRGPIKYLYRYNKRRIRTLHLLTLNVVKYIIYFAALGFILSELGVDYTAYLASLSIVGLAIGFGSQGLVQDVVTGFFVIFEGQFDVGDIIDVSGQTGAVVEFGLRTTQLRNYFGQTIIIPNRNIMVVGNYGLAGLRATVDVTLPPEADPARARELLRRIAQDLRMEFPGVIVRDAVLEEAVTFTTGEHLLRLRLPIWPGQQWIIDQQLVPRIKELFAREKLPLLNERLVASYHPPEEHKRMSIADRLQQRFHWRRGRPEREEPEADEDFEI